MLFLAFQVSGTVEQCRVPRDDIIFLVNNRLVV